MTARAKERAGWGVFLVGLAMMLAEYLLHVWSHFRPPEYRVSLGALGIGAVFTFIGWFWLYRQDALVGGRFILDGVMGVLGVIRGGRRATDPPVLVPAVEPPHVPSEPPSPGGA